MSFWHLLHTRIVLQCFDRFQRTEDSRRRQMDVARLGGCRGRMGRCPVSVAESCKLSMKITVLISSPCPEPCQVVYGILWLKTTDHTKFHVLINSISQKKYDPFQSPPIPAGGAWWDGGRALGLAEWGEGHRDASRSREAPSWVLASGCHRATVRGVDSRGGAHRFWVRDVRAWYVQVWCEVRWGSSTGDNNRFTIMLRHCFRHRALPDVCMCGVGERVSE